MLMVSFYYSKENRMTRDKYTDKIHNILTRTSILILLELSPPEI